MGGFLQLLCGDGKDVAVHFFEGVDMVEIEVCLTDALHLVEAGVVGDGHLTYELGLRGMELLRGERHIAQLTQLGEDKLCGTLGGTAVDTGIDVEKITGTSDMYSLPS